MSVREQLSLDGVWRIAFDPANTGKIRQWHEPERFFEHGEFEEIRVPSCWETLRQDYEGAAWYGRRFSVPAAWQGRSVRLRFGAANYRAEAYVNGQPAGFHEGGYTRFEFEIADLLDFESENALVVRVIGPIVTQDIVIDGLGRNDMPHWRGAIAGGLWQSVEIEASATVRIQDLFARPDWAAGAVEADAAVENLGLKRRHLLARARVFPWRDESQICAEFETPLDAAPGESAFHARLVIPGARAWTLDDPFLYGLEIQLIEEGQVADAFRTRFGLREFTIRDNDFVFNGDPLFLKAVFHEGLYPNTLALPPSEEFVRREIQLVKEGGFNCIRPWRKPPPPFVYDLADEMGMLFIGSFPIECMNNWPSITPYTGQRIETEVREAILRDRNHPSIISWEIFNEIMRDGLRRLKHRMSMLARRLDPTRLVLDESGGFAGGAALYLPGKTEPIRINDVHNYPGGPLDEPSYKRFLALGKTDEERLAMGVAPAARHGGSQIAPGLLTHISEIGYGSWPDLETNCWRYEREGNPLAPDYRYHRDLLFSLKRALADSGFDGLYPDFKAYCEKSQEIHSQANKRMLEAARCNPGVDGYCVHAFCDGDWILGAGLVDLFREPKQAYYGTREANQPLCLAVRAAPRNVYAANGTTLRLTAVNERAPFQGRLRLRIASESGVVALEEESAVPIGRGVTALRELRLDCRRLDGLCVAEAWLDGQNAKERARNSFEFRVFGAEALASPGGVSVAVIDGAGRLRRFLQAAGVSWMEFSDSTPLAAPLLVADSGADEAAASGPLQRVSAFVEAGGSAAMLSLPPGKSDPPWGVTQSARRPWLPGPIRFRAARGLWTGVAHFVKRHPVSQGLPAGCMMEQDYENVYPIRTMLESPGELICGSVSYGWWQGRKHMQDYRGPEPAFWGGDLAVVRRGHGRYVLSTLRLLENLGADPVADRLVLNMIRWLGGGPLGG